MENPLLRLETAFDFVPQEGDYEGYEIIPFVREEREEGVDISLYQDSKLCLSPHDFYDLGQLEEGITRELKPSDIMAPFYIILKWLIQENPGFERRYEIKKPNIFEDETIKETLVETANLTDLEIFTDYWAREHPENYWADKYSGNDFNAFFMERGQSSKPSLTVANLSYGYRMRISGRGLTNQLRNTLRSLIYSLN